MSDTSPDGTEQPVSVDGVPSGAGEWVELIDTIDEQITQIRDKVENGRVRSPENEKVRIEWHRRLTESLSKKKDILEAAPVSNSGRCSDTRSGKSVYIVEADGVYKIGISANPRKRLKSLQTSSPVGLEFIYETKPIEDAFLVEAGVHKEFSEYRRHGEWFDLTDELLGDVLQYIQYHSSDGVKRDADTDIQQGDV